MPRFRKKPVEIEAFQFTGDNCIEIVRFIGGPWTNPDLHNSDKPVIRTLEGDMTASVGDWIIKGIQGEFYPCKPDIFEQTYDVVPETAIDRLHAKIKDRVGVPEDRRVVTLEREVYVPDPDHQTVVETAQESPAEPVQDPELVELLKDALKDAEAGKVHGGALFVGIPTPDGENIYNVMCSSTSKVEDHLNLFVGAMEVAKLEFHQIAQDIYFGDEEYDEE